MKFSTHSVIHGRATIARLFALSLALAFTSGCEVLYSIAGRNNTALKYEKVVTTNLDKTQTFTYQVADASGVHQETGVVVSLRDEYLKARQDAYLANSDPAKNLLYFKKAAAFSDAITEAWFEALFTEVRQHRYNLDLFNILSSAGNSVAALAKANSSITGGLSIGQGLVNAEAQNYSANFLFTPEIEQLKTKLTAARSQLRDAIIAEDKNFVAFDDTQRAFMRYDETRTPSYVQDLLRKSTDLVKFEVANTADVAKQASIQVMLVRLAESLHVSGGLTADDAKGIYLLVHAKTTKAAEDFKSTNPNLAAKVTPQITNPTGDFEESLRALNGLLDLSGYAKQIAQQEIDDEKKKQQQIAATANVTPTPAAATAAPAVAQTSSGEKMLLQSFTAQDLSAIEATEPTGSQKLADSQARIDALQQIVRTETPVNPAQPAPARPNLQIVPEPR